MTDKEAFYEAMDYNSSIDDDLDDFREFQSGNPGSVVRSQNLEMAVDAEPLQVSSQQPAQSPSLTSNIGRKYLSSIAQINHALALKTKDMVRVESDRLGGRVLFYWPVMVLKSKSRQLAYKKVIAHGGELALEWDHGHRITHIVLDRNLTLKYQEVLTKLEVQSLPDHVQVVKSDWVNAVMTNRHPKSEDRYRLLGHPSSSKTSSGDRRTYDKKRSASEAPADGLHRNVLRPPAAQIPALKRSKTEVSQDALVNADHGQLDQDILTSSPKLMNQQRKGRRHFTATATFQLIESDRPRNSSSDEDIKQAKKMQTAQRNGRTPFQTDRLSNPITENGRNIDRLPHELAEDAGREEDEDDFDEDGHRSPENSSTTDRPAKYFLCANKNLTRALERGPNAALIEQLKILADHYSHNSEDAFRAKGYREAISVLRRQRHKIITTEQALALKRIGSSIAAKIGAFGRYGKIDLVESLTIDPKQQAIKLFTGVYGVGQKTAEAYYNQGLRSLEDLSKIELYQHQRVGLEHYDDFGSRIPRAEVSEHVEFVTAAAHKISEHLEVVVGGSYRRGQADSGDIDFLVTAPDSLVSTTQLQKLVFEQLIPSLRQCDYIKADLTIPNEKKDSSKWLGAACLPGITPEIWRRVDILLVPNAEWGAALIYFTGNDIFNRSMRLLARRNGASLNQRGLCKGVIRGPGGVKVSAGTLVEARDEKKIFEALGVKWRPPHERCP